MPTIYDNPMFQQQPQGTPPAATPVATTAPTTTNIPQIGTGNIFGPGGAFAPVNGNQYQGPATTAPPPTTNQPSATNTFGAGGAFGTVDPVTGLTRSFNSQGQAYGNLPSNNTYGPGGPFGAPSTGSGNPAENDGLGTTGNTMPEPAAPQKQHPVARALMNKQSYFNPSTGMFNW
jgi:hypothetical protein